MKCFGATDIGLVRSSNQDSYVIASNEAGDVFALVCDGIGGGNSGDVASQTAIQYFSEVFSTNKGFKDEEEALTWMRFHIRKANDAIFTLAATKKEYQGMGTTMVGVLLIPEGRYVINIGDSRVYATFSDGSFRCLTQDHTLVQELVNHGELKPEEIASHPKRNMLTNALGIWDNVRIDLLRVEDVVDTFLLCSDGLHGYVPEPILSRIMQDPRLTLQGKSKQLMNIALLQGGYDNITIILIQTEEGDPR